MAVGNEGGCIEDPTTGSLDFMITLTRSDARALTEWQRLPHTQEELGRRVIEAMRDAYRNNRFTFGIDVAMTPDLPPRTGRFWSSGVALIEGEYVLVPWHHREGPLA